MPRKIKYLIDTENVGSSWTELLPILGRNDELLLFYTPNSPGIPYKDLLAIMERPAQMELIPCHTGKNGLDFQLSSYLGFLLRSSAKAQYVILSRDTGYDPLVQFWNDRGADVVRCTAKEIAAARAAAETEKAKGRAKEEPKAPSLDERMEKLVPEAFRTPEDIRDMVSIVREYYPSGLQEVNKALLSRFGYDGGNDLYRALKPSFRDICSAAPQRN